MRSESEKTGEISREMLNTYKCPILKSELVEVYYLVRDKQTGEFGFWLPAGFQYVPTENVIATLKKKGHWAVGQEEDGVVKKYALKQVFH